MFIHLGVELRPGDPQEARCLGPVAPCSRERPLDEVALYGTLASPLVGLSRDGLALLSRAAQEAGRGVWQTALSTPPQELSGSDGEALAAFGLAILGLVIAALQGSVSAAFAVLQPVVTAESPRRDRWPIHGRFAPALR